MPNHLYEDQGKLYSNSECLTQGALTAQLTTVTCSAPGTPDYAIADLTTTSPYGFASADEGQTLLKVVANQQIRLAELEVLLKAAHIIT